MGEKKTAEQEMREELESVVQKWLPQLVPAPKLVIVEVNVRFSEDPHVAVQLNLPPVVEEVPVDFWEAALNHIPESSYELRTVLQTFSKSRNTPLTMAQMSEITKAAANRTFRKDKMSGLNFHLKQAQPNQNPMFLLSRFQSRLQPGEEAKYFIKKRRY